jgi:hypothetical protein
MPEIMPVRELRPRQLPITLVPPARDALHEALDCLDSAGRELRRGNVERADEVLALLQAAASHLETAWDMASGAEVPLHLRGAE